MMILTILSNNLHILPFQFLRCYETHSHLGPSPAATSTASSLPPAQIQRDVDSVSHLVEVTTRIFGKKFKIILQSIVTFPGGPDQSEGDQGQPEEPRGDQPETARPGEIFITRTISKISRSAL